MSPGCSFSASPTAAASVTVGPMTASRPAEGRARNNVWKEPGLGPGAKAGDVPPTDPDFYCNLVVKQEARLLKRPHWTVRCARRSREAVRAGQTAFGCGPRAHHARALHRVSDMPYFALPAPASRPKKCRSELRVIGLATEVALRVQRDELSRLPPLDVQVTRGAHLHVMASRSFHRWSTAERPFLYREDRHCQQSEPAKDSDVTEP